MALTERLAIILETVGTQGVVRDFGRVGKASKGLGVDAGLGAKGVDRLGRAGLAGGAALKAGLAAGAAIAARKVVDLGAVAIQMSSALEEQTSGARVTFGRFGDDIVEWADQFSGLMGLSRSEALAAANSFGVLFNQAGASTESTLKASRSLVQLAGDIASRFDIAGGVPAVLEKLRAGLVGEAEPLRTVGIFLSETAVKAKAAELGLGGANRELTDGEKIAARYAIIIEQSSGAQGDMARTGDSLANQQRKLAADVKRLQEELGAALVPAATDAVKALRGLIDVGRDIADVVGVATGKIEALTGGLADLGIAGRVGLGLFTGGLSEVTRWLIRQAEAADEDADALPPLLELLELGAEINRDIADSQRDVTDTTLAASAAQRAYDTSLRRVGAAERTLADTRRDLNRLLEEGAVDEERVADARRSLADATRSLGSAQRRLRGAQEDYNDALANFQRFGSDTAADELADATDNLADANDAVASATERQTGAAEDLQAALAGDPDFNNKLADAKQRVVDAEISLEGAQYDSAQAAYELDGALTKQNTTVAGNAAAVKSVREEWGELLALRPEIEAFLAGPLSRLPAEPPPPPQLGPGYGLRQYENPSPPATPTGGTGTAPGTPGGGGGGGTTTVEKIVNIAIDIKDAVTNPASLGERIARQIVWEIGP